MDGKRKLEGARAFNNGVERDRCPYAPGTISFQDWTDGWAQQKAEFEKRVQMERAEMRFRKAS